MIFFKYLVIYFIILLGSIFFSGIFKKKICQTLPISIMSIIILLYVLGLCGILKLGVIIVSLLYIIAAICIIIVELKNKTLKNFIKTNFSYGFIIFTILFMVFGFTTYNRVFTAADDYGYWSLAAKNMYYLDDFIASPKAMIKTIYPPVPTLLQYYFEKIVSENRQGIELFASMILGFSLFLPLFKNLESKRKTECICILGIILFIPAIFVDSWFYGMIYVDTLMGLMIGYILFEYYTVEDKKFMIFSICVALAVLTLIKPTGFFISIITIGTLILNYIINILKEEKKNFKTLLKSIFNKNELKTVIAFLLVCIITILSWKIYVNIVSDNSNIEINQNDNYEGNNIIVYFIKIIIKSIVGTNSPNADVISNINLFESIFESRIYSHIPIDLSAGTWFVLFSLATFIIYKNIRSTSNRSKFIVFMMSVFIGTAVYICFLQTAYILKFVDYEAMVHASIERYIGTYLVAELFVIVGIALNDLNMQKNRDIFKYYIILSAICLFTPITPIANLTVVSEPVNTRIKENINYMIEMTNDVKNVVDVNDKIYALDQNSNKNEDITKFRYYMYPINVSGLIRIDEKEKEEDIKTQKKEWVEKIYNNYDYFIILDTNDYLNNYYSDLFEGNEIKSWSVYQVEKQDDIEIKLLPIYTYSNEEML